MSSVPAGGVFCAAGVTAGDSITRVNNISLTCLKPDQVTKILSGMIGQVSVILQRVTRVAEDGMAQAKKRKMRQALLYQRCDKYENMRVKGNQAR